MSLSIYIISSSRNILAVQLLGNAFRAAGHEVLDWTTLAPPLPLSLSVEERRRAMDSDERGEIFEFCTQACTSADLAVYIGMSAGQDSACEVGIAFASGVPVIGFAALDEMPGTIMSRAVYHWSTSLPDLLQAVEVFEFELRKCRVCGCTDNRACVDENGVPCHWIEPDLCSACVDGGE
jgi:hypothetical protein